MKLPYLFEYNTHSYITRTLNFWMKKLLRHVAVTKYLLITYGTLVKQTASISTIPKWNLQFKTGFIIRFTKQLFELFLSYVYISVQKRNNNKACWWKKSCITRTLNFWLKFRTKFCALHSNKYGDCFRIVFIQKRCCLNICLVGRLLFFALTGEHLAFVFFTLSSTGGVQRIVWLSKFLTSRHVQMLRILFYISQRNLMNRAEGLVFSLIVSG